jgi:formiminoglutamase
MKISPVNPKAYAGISNLDDSRLGNHVAPVELNDLGTLKHGIVVLGFADETGIKNVGGRLGAAAAPEALRQKFYKFTLGKPIIPIYDLGDLPPQKSIEETHRAATDIVRKVLEYGHTPVVIGGGHDFGYPHALGLLEARGGKKPAAFVNIDAHLDVRPATEIVTSGSPWYLLREHFLYQQSKSRVVEFGLQDHCNAHSLVDYAKKHKFEMHWLPNLRAQKTPVTAQFQKLLKKLSTLDSVLVSLDIDAVQWAEAPGCSAPQTEGFTANEAIGMSELSGAAPKVKTFGLFELSPALDPDGRTAALSAHCIKAFLRGRGVWGRKK